MARQFIDRFGHLFRSARRQVVAKTASYTVTLDDAGTLFTNRGAAGAVTFTLPAAARATGIEYMFVAVANQNLIVSDGGVDSIVAINDAAADSVAFQTASEIIGGGFRVISDGTSWLVFPSIWDNGTAVSTITVAT